MGEACYNYEEKETCTQASARKPEGKKKLERLRRRWVVKIIFVIQEIGLFWPRIGKMAGRFDYGNEPSG